MLGADFFLVADAEHAENGTTYSAFFRVYPRFPRPTLGKLCGLCVSARDLSAYPFSLSACSGLRYASALRGSSLVRNVSCVGW